TSLILHLSSSFSPCARLSHSSSHLRICSFAFHFPISLFFFFNDTATTEIYTLSLHDALPISILDQPSILCNRPLALDPGPRGTRSEEHTSELQLLTNLVCRLLLEKKKKKRQYRQHPTHHASIAAAQTEVPTSVQTT